MLLELNISNFILIQRLRIEFGMGLNVLSGETGAGKSMIIDALNLLLGERQRGDYLREPEHKASIEAVFSLEDNAAARNLLLERGLLEAEEQIAVLNRELQPNGRSGARINGYNVTNSLLKQLRPLLVDLQGQEDRFRLLNPVVYRHYLDRFIPAAEDLLNPVAEAWEQLQLGRQRWEELQQYSQAREQQLEQLQAVIAELQEARLQPEEEAELLRLQQRVTHAAQLLKSGEAILGELYRDPVQPSAYDRIFQALKMLRRLPEEKVLTDLLDPLESCYYQLEAMAVKLQTWCEQLDILPDRADQIDERLYQLRYLQKRYQRDIPQLIEHLNESQQKYEQLLHLEASSERLEAEIIALTTDYAAKAEALSAARRQAAHLLEAQLSEEMHRLNLPDAVIQVALTSRPVGSREGWDEVELQFSANPGETAVPLERAASGGEISRFILALKTALAEEYRIPTLIFDEIDMGVGGSTLHAMAQKIKQLAQQHQLIVITHSPQLASFADQHYLIHKERHESRNSVNLLLLDQEQRLMELARMQEGDDYSPLALEHARAMITRAENTSDPEPPGSDQDK